MKEAFCDGNVLLTNSCLYGIHENEKGHKHQFTVSVAVFLIESILY